MTTETGRHFETTLASCQQTCWKPNLHASCPEGGASRLPSLRCSLLLSFSTSQLSLNIYRLESKSVLTRSWCAAAPPSSSASCGCRNNSVCSSLLKWNEGEECGLPPLPTLYGKRAFYCLLNGALLYLYLALLCSQTTGGRGFLSAFFLSFLS